MNAQERTFAYHQLGELLCDTMSVLVVGPASPLTLGTLVHPDAEADGPMNDHPPLSSRVCFLFDMIRGAGRANEFDNDINTMQQSWLSAAGLARGRKPAYVEKYNRFLNAHRADFVEVAKDHMLADPSKLFTGSKWAMAKTLVESEFKELPRGLDAVAVLNAPWARRWYTFPKMSAVYHEKGIHIIAQRESESKFTPQVIGLINKCLRKDAVAVPPLIARAS